MNAIHASPAPGAFGRKRQGQDFDLNLAPIIDCFTVLIAFVMISASFASMGVLDAGLAAAGETAAVPQGPPPVRITVSLEDTRGFKVLVSGKEKQELTVAAGEAGTRSYEELGRKLNELKARWPGVSGATVSADDSVDYQDVVKTMDVTRKIFPAVLLGGF